MRLCKLNASNCQDFWGDPEEPVSREATIVGQATDCSSFLLLTSEAETYLVESPNMEDFDFTFCQEWGLRITPEVVRRVRKAIRDEALNDMLYAFADGRVVQVRPQDLPNFRSAISIGTSQEWVLADNTPAALTVAEMEEAVQAGMVQAEAIWKTYTDGLR